MKFRYAKAKCLYTFSVKILVSLLINIFGVPTMGVRVSCDLFRVLGLGSFFTDMSFK